MKDALVDYKKYDQLIVDEADDCIENHGTLYEDDKQRFTAFWDVFETPTIFLTATVNQNMEDILFQLYGISKQKYATTEELNKDNPNKLPEAVISYKVMKHFDEVDLAVFDIIRSKVDEKPIIIFVKDKGLFRAFKKSLGQFEQHKYYIEKDDDLDRTRIAIRNQDSGILLADFKYGRGSDLRFQVDSHVIINFMPKNYDHLI